MKKKTNSTTLKLGQSFANYILECRKYISQQHRKIANLSTERMVAINAPFEWHPDTSFKTSHGYRRAAIMIHGLNESAFSLRDVAHHLTEKGFLVRGLLLPGHGTTPQDLMKFKYQDWLKTVIYAIRDAQQYAQEVYIYGFSLGSTLALHAALKDEPIDGLILFAPAIATKSPLAYLGRWHKYLMQKLGGRKWSRSRAEVDYAKYCSSSYKCMNETLKGMRYVRYLMKKKPLKTPIFAVSTVDDETINTPAFIRLFQKIPQHINKKLILYNSSKPKKNLLKDPTIMYRNSSFPAAKILNFSHTSLHHAEDNPHYGMDPDYYDYLHYANAPKTNKKADYLGAITPQNMRKGTLARLHYNPDLKQLLDQLDEFIENI